MRTPIYVISPWALGQVPLSEDGHGYWQGWGCVVPRFGEVTAVSPEQMVLGIAAGLVPALIPQIPQEQALNAL